MELRSNVPTGEIESAWERHRFNMKLVNPANKRKFDVIVVGTGLAGASAAATMGELGYNVKAFCFQDSPRRAHSIAAQGGINAAKNYQGDGDSVYRLFYDTVKGGDFRSREANVYRLAQLSVNIIDQAVAQGFHLPATTADCSQTAHSAVPRFREPLRTWTDRTTATPRRIPSVVETNRIWRGYHVPANGDARAYRPPGPRARYCHAMPKDGQRRGAYRGRGGTRDRWLRKCFFPLHQRDGLQCHGELAGTPTWCVVRQPLLHTDTSDVYSSEWEAPVEAHPDE